MSTSDLALPSPRPQAVLVRPRADVSGGVGGGAGGVGTLGRALRRLGLAGEAPPPDPTEAAAARERWEALDERPHAASYPGRAHERWAVSIEARGTRTAVSLLRYRDASYDQEERVEVWVQDGRTFPPGADPAAMAALVERFTDRARELEADAYAGLQAASIEHQRRSQLAQRSAQTAEQLRAQARGRGDAGHMTPLQALAERRHREDFPGTAHTAYAVQLTEQGGAPVVRLLGFNPAFPGKAERSEHFVVREQSFDHEVPVATLTERTLEWAIQARREEWKAFQPFAGRHERREEQELQQAARAELEREMREEAATTIAAARRAISG